MFRKRNIEKWLMDSLSMLLMFAAGVACTFTIMKNRDPATGDRSWL